MSLFPRHLWLALACGALAFAAPAAMDHAWADQASAAACAETLPPEAMTIYRAVAPEVTPATDLRSLLTTRVKAMVIGGTVQRATARNSAYAAYGCLKNLK